MTKREIAMKVAWHYLGKPYIWGGDDPEGFDCSGFIIEVLKSAGILPRRGDWTADGLRAYLVKEGYNIMPVVGEGVLIFFFKQYSDRVNHVEICVGQGLSLGASGGGSHVKTFRDAMDYNAFIKVRPHISDKRYKIFIDPFSK